MKKLIIPIGALLITSLAHAQLTPTENYIYTKTYLSDPTLPTPKTSETVQYVDGLGRPKQVVSIKASPLGRDVVSHIEYDQFGRQVKEYLPVPQGGTMNGAIVPTPLANATQTDLYGSEKIYAEKTLENSPLDRILEQRQVGNAWNNKPVKFNYDANVSGEVIKYATTTTWENGATRPVITYSGTYGTGQLYKNSVKDEDGNETIEFKNGKGQTLLVRKVISATENADTYYVYNEYDQLAFVISPKAVQQITANNNVITQAIADQLCYQYNYDGRGRNVEKKLPAKGWEYMVYDRTDRLVLSQDANLKAQGKWIITKYDLFGRVIYTGILSSGGERAARQNEINELAITESRSVTGFTRNGITVYYTDNNFVGEIPTILSINYYDTYPSYSFNPAFPADIQGAALLTEVPSNNGRSTKGLPVMSLVKNIEDDNWTKNYTYYDTKGRAVGGHSINHLGGYTRTESQLDFAGVPLKSVTKHKRLDTDTENFEYDQQNRLLVHKHQVDSNPEEILAQNKYNELSQLESKKVGGIMAASPLQQIDYQYNIRGWLTKINDPANLNGKLFGYEMRYNNPLNSTIAPGRFNGNIAEIDWKNSTEDVLKRYNYEYDNLNRLKNAFYKEPTTGNTTYFDEYLTYDLNGNIMTLKRNAPQVFSPTATMIDNLEYQYTGNRLDRVIENQWNSTGYEGGNNLIDYDLNGNMTNMKDKGIQGISYNHINLADSYFITQNNPFGTSMNFGLNYLYRADGVKVRKTYSTGGGRGQSTSYKYTDYLDSFQYSFSETVAPCPWCRTSVAYEQEAFKDPILLDPPPFGSLGWLLDFVPTSEGFYSFTENRYIYQYKDHLGNARVSFAKNAGGILEVTDTNNYYAFGMNYIGGIKSSLGRYQNYKYNGKELQETGMYDYGARMYMPDLGRWGVVDPLAEKNRAWSPYRYAYDNPMIFIDPDGRFETKFGAWWHRMWNAGGNGSGIKYDSRREQYYYNRLNESKGNEVNFSSVYNKQSKDAGNFVFKVEVSGSLGVQAGAKLGGPLQVSGEAGILSTDLGKAGWSNSDGFYAKKGDGKGHNFISGGIKILSKQLSVGGKADYVTNDAVPTAGDLLDYYSDNGHLEWEGNIGPGKSHLSPPKGSDADILNVGLKSKVRGSNRENCAFCADLGVGVKALLGVDLKLTTGFTGSSN